MIQLRNLYKNFISRIVHTCKCFCINDTGIYKPADEMFCAGSRAKKLILALLLTGAAVRIFIFGSVPPGLNQDEASIGYEAFSIMKYGIDRNGFSNPVHLVAWGSGQNALYAYFSMPFIALMGLNEISTRMVNLIFGLISLCAFYFLVFKTAGIKAAILSLFLLVINPWHIMISRWALESNLFPSIFLLAVLALVSSLKKACLFPVSMFLFALSLYAYGTSYFIIPVFLIIVISYLLYHKKIKFKILLPGAAIFIITAFPILIFLLINQFKLETVHLGIFTVPRLTGSPRYNTISTIFRGDFVHNTLLNLNHFLKFMLTQNDNLIWNTTPHFGFMYLFTLPFTLIGLWSVFRRHGKLRVFTIRTIFVIWFLVSVMTAMISEINTNRINIIFFPLIYFTAEGILYIAEKSRFFLSLILVVYSIAFASFSYYYFTDYPKEIEQSFFASFGEAIKYASELKPSKVYVTDKVNMPYIYVLFYTRTDPRTYIQTVVFDDPSSDFQRVLAFDKYTFGISKVNRFEDAVYIIDNSEEYQFPPQIFEIKRFKYYSVVTRKAVSE